MRTSITESIRMSLPRPSVSPALGLLAAVALAAPAHASTHYVDAIAGDDVTGDGSAAAPWRTITRAHAESLAFGDVVEVAPGVYNAALGEVFPIELQRGVQVIGAGPSRTFVRGGGDDTLFETGTGQVYFWLANMSLSRAGTAIEQDVPSGSDTFLVLERLVIEGCDIGVRGADTTGAYCQTALVNCFLHDNATAIRSEENWSGFGETFLYVYGTTISGNGKGIQGTTFWDIGPRFTMKHSIVKNNDDDLFLEGVTVIFGSPPEGNLTAEPSLDGVDGNQNAPAGFVNAVGDDPHLRTDSPAIDRFGATTPWPPQPLPSSWWGGTPWAASFADVPDIDGRARTDGLHDAGCDELELPTFHTWGQSSIASTVDLVALGTPLDPMALFFSLGASTPIPTPAGLWELDLPAPLLFTLVLDADGHRVLPGSVPPNPAFAGLDVYFQGLAATPPLLTAVEWMRFLP